MEFIQANSNFKKDILNIQVITNNRDDALFRYFIPSLKFLTGIKDICSVSVQYNGNITEEKIAEANKLITDFGFNLYWAYTKYEFEKDKHAVLKIRRDCDWIKQPQSPYVLLVDDDSEFLEGYVNNLLIALNCLKDHKDIGMIAFDRGVKNQYFSVYNSVSTDEHEVYPVVPKTMMGLLGGLLIARQDDNVYIKEVQDLWGGGEERVLHFTMMYRGLKTYRMSNSNYLHEQHWQHNEQICGQHIYGWRWGENEEGCIAWWIEQFKKGNISSPAMEAMPAYETYKTEVFRYEQDIITLYTNLLQG